MNQLLRLLDCELCENRIRRIWPAAFTRAAKADEQFLFGLGEKRQYAARHQTEGAVQREGEINMNKSERERSYF